MMRAPVLESVAPIEAGWRILAAEADAIRPMENVAVSVAAVRHRILDNKGGGHVGPWLNELAPWLVEPMDSCTDPRYAITGIMGPAQCGKSEIANNWLLQAAIYAPANFVWLQADKVLMGEYVTSKIDPMIKLSPALAARQLSDVGADNVYRKIFKRQMIVSFIWPVPAQLRMRNAPNWVIDDYDDVKDSIGGQGNVIVLIGGRQISYRGAGHGLVISSPAKGKKKGIEGLIATGTDKTWRVRCTECGERFAIESEQLDFERRGTPEDAAGSVVLMCPVNGCPIPPRKKWPLARSGVFAGPEQTVTPEGEIIGPLKVTDRDTYRFDGAFAFEDWQDNAKGRRAAEIEFERTQDEAQLRAFVNIHQGQNYTSQVENEEPVEFTALEKRAQASGYVSGTVPGDVVCLTAAVDCQGRRFAVMVMGWKIGGESCVIDRYDIISLPDGLTAIDPGRHPEHFEVLVEMVIWRRYPVAGKPGWSMPILNTVIDRGGQAGVTENVSAFWYACHHKEIPSTAVTAIHGGSNPKAKLLSGPTRDTSRKPDKEDPDEEYWVPNVHRVKDIIDMRLRQETPGPGFIDFPRDIKPLHLAEITAEEKVDGAWQRKEGEAGHANESWDLLGYNAVALIRLGGSDISLAWVPDWARAAEAPLKPILTEDDGDDGLRIEPIRMN